MLQMPDFECPFVVTTDASLVSVGAILEQDFGQGHQPVAFESRKLNLAETRYSVYERELLGIVWAIGNGGITSKEGSLSSRQTTPPYVICLTNPV